MDKIIKYLEDNYEFKKYSNRYPKNVWNLEKESFYVMLKEEYPFLYKILNKIYPVKYVSILREDKIWLHKRLEDKTLLELEISKVPIEVLIYNTNNDFKPDFNGDNYSITLYGKENTGKLIFFYVNNNHLSLIDKKLLKHNGLKKEIRKNKIKNLFD
jgi:hypothetical protein